MSDTECPVNDPDCEGADGDCHDACEAPVEDRITAALDRVGAPTQKDDEQLDAAERLELLLVRLAERMTGIAKANAALVDTLHAVRTLLIGSPNASQFRVKSAIKLITDTITPPRAAP